MNIKKNLQLVGIKFQMFWKFIELGPVHTSHFCRVEFNSIKCGRNATADSYVEFLPNLILWIDTAVQVRQRKNVTKVT